jgi:hypothetical protein
MSLEVTFVQKRIQGSERGHSKVRLIRGFRAENRNGKHGKVVRVQNNEGVKIKMERKIGYEKGWGRTAETV